MFGRLFASLGIDYLQWRALSRALLKIDFRVGAMSAVLGQQTKEKPSTHLLSVMAFYLFTGIFLAGFVLMNDDIFLTGTLLSAYVLLMIGSVVLVEYNSVVISPDDYQILGYRPISSRTFFAVRLTNVFFYVGIMTAAMIVLPVAAYFFTLGFRPLLGLAALLAFFTAGFSAALFMMVLFAAALSHVHPNRLRRVLSYLQLITSFAIFGSYAFLPRVFSEDTATAHLVVNERPWLLLFPPAWYASYLKLAVGDFEITTWLPVGFSLVVVLLLFAYAGGNLSLDYARKLGSLQERTEQPVARKVSRDRWLAGLFGAEEPRAVALLIRSQFRHDQKFRLSVLGILPLTAFYLIVALMSGPLPDPFVAGLEGFGDSLLVYLGVLLFPLMLQTNLRSSDYFQASWIFFSSPIRRDRLVLSAKNFVVVYFLLPYLLLIGILFGYFYTTLWHAVVNVVVLGLLAHLVLQIAVMLSPSIPFSQPMKKGERSAQMVLIMTIMPAVMLGFLSIVLIWIYPSAALTAVLVVALTGLTVGVENRLAARIRRRLNRLQFQG
ncbi:MAG TPA: hypothetical protein PLP42_04960 [Acidobacteriota bacterium]|nr:hypothetical protein [Acidobacteriota bacterium]